MHVTVNNSDEYAKHVRLDTSVAKPVGGKFIVRGGRKNPAGAGRQ